MIVIPCSGGTLGAIAHGIARDLLQRAADVCLKERRPLILAFRESPYSLVHVENMRSVTLAGADRGPPHARLLRRLPFRRALPRRLLRACRADAAASCRAATSFRWTGKAAPAHGRRRNGERGGRRRRLPVPPDDARGDQVLAHALRTAVRPAGRVPRGGRLAARRDARQDSPGHGRSTERRDGPQPARGPAPRRRKPAHGRARPADGRPVGRRSSACSSPRRSSSFSPPRRA